MLSPILLYPVDGRAKVIPHLHHIPYIYYDNSPQMANAVIMAEHTVSHATRRAATLNMTHAE
ncbi:MAG: hypothetical protein EA396_10390 [Anaerolineaceae bacterium]|nr:MAG: hypothetical protein EA396_10390 [Anaerolineaceae bacterium]